MPIDLDTRLADYARTIDDAIEHSIKRADWSLHEAPASSSGRGALVGLAAAAVAVLGLGVFAVTREDAGAPAAQPLDTLPAVDPAVDAAKNPPSAGNVIDVPQSASDIWMPPWDPIRIAPGTIGWFEAGDDLPPEIALLPQNETIPDDTARSAFFFCASWTIDADGPICDRLAGGNGIEHVTFGDRLGIGVQLGATTAQDQLWVQARGSLWPYDIGTEPPDSTVIRVGDRDGYSYRDGDDAYLAWEYEPGVVVWINGRGLSDAELGQIAVGVRPAELPAALPVLLLLTTPSGEVGPGATSNETAVKLGFLSGRQCVGIQLWETCTATDTPGLFGAAAFGDGLVDQYAAVAPSGSGLVLEAQTFGDGTERISLTPTELGFDLARWESKGSRLLSARLVDATGVVVADSGALSSRPDDPRLVIAEGSTNGIDWIVQRQDPAQQAELSEMYFGPTESATTIPYCVLLSASGEFAPLCPPPEPPVSGLGSRADYHETLDLVEIAADVTSVRCNGVDMTILVDDQLDGRRFAVVSCDDPTTT